jgi:putative hydrolase of HD superfamily
MVSVKDSVVTELNLEARLAFVKQAENLKNTLRSAHTSSGREESVAEHTWRLTLLVITFADLLEEVDTLQLLKLCILHDLGEVISGDIPAPMQIDNEDKSVQEREDFMTLIAGLPKTVKSEFLTLWDDYDQAESSEAKLAKAFDKIETMMQHNQGKNSDKFDYAFNLDYGRDFTDAYPLTASIRRRVDTETKQNAGLIEGA